MALLISAPTPPFFTPPPSSSPSLKISISPSVLGVHIPIWVMKRTSTRIGAVIVAAADGSLIDKPTKLVTFLGKGGSGKTTSAVFAAQHYAMAGFRTCLVIHSQDPTAEYLLNCKIGASPMTCNNNLSAVRLETTKMLLEPLNRMKEADAQLNLTQGILEGVVGEELGVLPGMDSIFAALSLDRLVGIFTNAVQQNSQKDKFDIILFDGISTEETIRMIGLTGKARLYLKYMRKLAEKTDFGRLAGPSLLRLVDETLSLSKRSINLNGKLSSEIWDFLEQSLERGSSVFGEQQTFSCYIVMDPHSHLSLNSALRYWGCAIQAGAQISGALSSASSNVSTELEEVVKKSCSPLPFARIPHVSSRNHPDWNEILLNSHSQDARHLLSFKGEKTQVPPPVKFDSADRSITLLMPGFDKSEIKLYQFRGGSELLVEAGDQRRVIQLPSQLQGKVGGAKFTERNLVITMR